MLKCLNLFPVNFPVVSGGFALLAGTGATVAGLGGAGALTGMIPLISAGTLGVLGEKYQ